MSLEEALVGLEIPPEIRETLALVDVPYLSFEGDVRSGQLVVHRDLVDETVEIFEKLVECKFPIQKVVPIVEYGWDDEASMQDNNTSAFNYRRIIGTDRLSNHSLGRAVDINPYLNPYYAYDGRVYPEGSRYEPGIPGTITKEGKVVRIFKERGWVWLGDREHNTDYQHFEKL